MTDTVQRDVGMLRGEMSGVQNDIKRMEKKVDDGFDSIRTQIQSLRDDRNFARGASYILTGLIAALVSAFMILLAKIFK